MTKTDQPQPSLPQADRTGAAPSEDCPPWRGTANRQVSAVQTATGDFYSSGLLAGTTQEACPRIHSTSG